MKPEVGAHWMQSFSKTVPTNSSLVSLPGLSVALEDPPGTTLQKSKYSWLPAHFFFYGDTLLLQRNQITEADPDSADLSLEKRKTGLHMAPQYLKQSRNIFYWFSCPRPYFSPSTTHRLLIHPSGALIFPPGKNSVLILLMSKAIMIVLLC